MATPIRPATHFDFGRTWARYETSVDDAAVLSAEAGLDRIGLSSLHGMTFLDIGCGSGIHSAAAARRGAYVTSIDVDLDSVETSNRLLKRLGLPSTARQQSVFDLRSADGSFDVVYSWGVLHHTGDVWRALDRAAARVAPGGLLAIALYEKSALCGVWAVEKRVYRKLPRALRVAVKAVYATALLVARSVRDRKSPMAFLRGYKGDRGMDFRRDVEDWLGGYPYEATKSNNVIDAITGKGFALEAHRPCRSGVGVFGTGCSEYLFRRQS